MHIVAVNDPEELKKLHAFCLSVIEDSYYPAYERRAMDMFYRYHTLERVRQEAMEGRTWAAYEGGELLGTATCAHGELSRMLVSASMRGCGLGSALLSEVFGYAGSSGVKRLTAWSVPFSSGFYGKHGFVMLNAETLDFNGSRAVPVPYIEMAHWLGSLPAVSILPAESQDAEELLAGQRLAFEEQCRLYSDWAIPPMIETQSGFHAFLASGGVWLKAVSSGSIIGAIRGNVENGVGHIGRLFVLPAWQGRGIARRLIASLEEALPACRIFSIFTGEKSDKNIALYMKQGYALTGRREPAREAGEGSQYSLVWLEKPNPWPEVRACQRRYRAR